MQKKLFEQWEIENFLESFDLKKVDLYVSTTDGVDIHLSDATVKYEDYFIKFKKNDCKIRVALRQIESLDVDESTEFAKVKAKLNPAAFFIMRYKNLKAPIRIRNNSNSNKSITPFYMEYGQNRTHNIHYVSNFYLALLVVS